MDAGGCSYLSPDCGTKAFCVVDSCDKAGTGTCKPLALLDKDALKPLCGCDGFTYWSGVEVIAANQPVGAMGECTDMTAKACSGTVPCPTGAFCSRERAACSENTTADKCWVLPSTCTGHTEGGQNCAGLTVGDAGLNCDPICKMITNGTPWAPDSNCPAL